jgi:Rod binding domain-containing protein
MKIQAADPIMNNVSVSELQQKQRLQEAGEGMEALFISMLISAMEKTIPQSGFTGSGNNSLAKMMFSNVMGKALAEQGGVGFAERMLTLMDTQDAASLEALQQPFSTEVWQQLQTTGVKDDDAKRF